MSNSVNVKNANQHQCTNSRPQVFSLLQVKMIVIHGIREKSVKIKVEVVFVES